MDICIVPRYLSSVTQLKDADYRALAEFRHKLRLFLAFSEEKAREFDLNPQQHQLLLAVRAFCSERPTIGALAEHLVLRHHSAVELVDRLERRQLVRRVRAAGDRRQIEVHLSKAGEQLLRSLALAHREELRRVGPRLVAALLRVLEESAPRGARRTRISLGKSQAKGHAKSQAKGEGKGKGIGDAHAWMERR